MEPLTIDGEHLTLDDVVRVAQEPPAGPRIALAPDAIARVERARRAVDEAIAAGQIVYGLNTGFGAFKDRIISPDETRQLQRNIIMSHAVGVGEPAGADVTRAMILVRANTLAKGHSGIRLETLNLLLDLLRRGVHPIIPCQGSLGASGDLAPLAHMALVLIGLGEAEFAGQVLPGALALARAGLRPVELGAKEGLALTNGTAFMCALAALTTARAENAARVADIAGALSLEALHGTPRAFDARIHAARPHPRQIEAAAYFRRLIEGSQFTRDDDPLNVQDAYTLRCIPQVHGAARDAILYARWVLNIELNSATDNPLVFFEKDGRPTWLSGGNFHGEPLAIAMDYLSLALTELGNISERRLTRLTDEASNANVLPAFLIKHGGLNSGFMLVQYTAAALASENKSLAHPASVDTIPTSANAEDHVSMGPIAARHAAQILRNLEWILAIELLSAAQGIDFRRQALGGAPRHGRGTAVAYELIRQQVPFLEHDDVMYPHIQAVHRIVVDGSLARQVESALGPAA
jgi:histidine ammonia-lyase